MELRSDDEPGEIDWYKVMSLVSERMNISSLKYQKSSYYRRFGGPKVSRVSLSRSTPVDIARPTTNLPKSDHAPVRHPYDRPVLSKSLSAVHGLMSSSFSQ